MKWSAIAWMIIILGVCSCSAYETYQVQQTTREYIKNGYERRDLGPWKGMGWVKK